MTIRTRWTKIFKDIWGNKSRSMLVVLSIAVGVAAIGMINQTVTNLRVNLFDAYSTGNPTSVSLYTSPAQKNLATAVEALREVETAQAHRTLGATVHLPGGGDKDITLHVIPDYHDIKLDRPTLEAGRIDPGLREITVERQAAQVLGIEVGDTLTVETNDEQTYSLRVVGIIHSLYEMPYNITGGIEAYTTMDTLRWMGQSAYYNRIDMVVADSQNDREYVLNVAADARDRVIEPGGYSVYSFNIPGINSNPGEHWAQNQINGFVLVLQVMSVLAIFLSGGLVINTISAILGQQIKQIGIMRSVGAVRSQLIRMYIVNVLVFSVLGLAVGLPLGVLGALGLTEFAASYLNFDVVNFSPAPGVTAIQIAVGLLMPVAVALYPIVAGTRISVYDAIYQYGLSSEGDDGWLERLLSKVRNLHPILMLAMRNTFRRKTRLVFTLITLTLAGAMFFSVFSTRASLNAQINQISRYVAFDASLGVSPGVTRTTAEREALRIPGVTVAEGWASATGTNIKPDGSEGEEINIIGLDPAGRTIDPLLIDGRWLRDDDSHQIVVNEDLLEQIPDVTVGSPLVIKIDGQERTFEVVGIVSKHLSGPRAYLTPSTFNKVTGQVNAISSVRVLLDPSGISGPAEQDRAATLLEDRFENAQLSTGSATTQHEIFGNFSSPFDIILIVLVIMALVLATVGGLSLTGTMGMNVLERTREIGVLRAVGANNDAVRQVVVIEGVVVGLISWFLALLISGPSGRALASAVVYAVFKTDLAFRYSVPGLVMWLVIIVVIGVVASLAPARNAARLTVREVLDYE